MELEKAKQIADETREQLLPYCYQCEIGGSIRRRKQEVKDIELVIVPKPYEIGILKYGLPEIVDQWEKVKGNLHPQKCKYTQRILPQGIKLDLFIVNEMNWGYQFVLRTGHVDFVRFRILPALKRNGYQCRDGYLMRDDAIVPVPTEQALFDFCRMEYVEPWNRII